LSGVELLGMLFVVVASVLILGTRRGGTDPAPPQDV